MKKLTAILLAVILVLCSSVFPVGALSLDFNYKISYGETITVKIPDSRLVSFAMVEFIPETSGYYALTSSSDALYDPCCDLYNGQTVELLETNDDYFGYDFCLKYEFEAGRVYYFMITDYNGNSGEIEITLGCGHNYADGFCTICSEECPHIPTTNRLGLCECEKTFAGTDIFEGDTFSYIYSEENENLNVFRFVPETDGAYTLSSSFGSEENFLYVWLYSKDFEYLVSSDIKEDFAFDFSYNFEAGKQYFFVICSYGEMTEATEITLEKAIHEALDGDIHSLSWAEVIYPSCTENGYTEGLYCEECDEYISGHEEIAADGHWDYDADGYCNLCDAEVELPDCSHICHSKNPVLAFCWRIINMFNRLFFRNPICECGAYHF